MSAPATLVIGDDLPFRADNVASGRTGNPATTATLTYQLIDQYTRSVVASGSMSQYDPITASYEAVIAKSVLAALSPKKQFVLRVIISNNGVQTTRNATLVALQDGLEA